MWSSQIVTVILTAVGYLVSNSCYSVRYDPISEQFYILICTQDRGIMQNNESEVYTSDTFFCNSYNVKQTHPVMLLPAIHCGSLDEPNHGSKEASNDLVGAVVTFSCDHGYRLNGSAKRTCTTQGTWNGAAAKCVGQL